MGNEVNESVIVLFIGTEWQQSHQHFDNAKIEKKIKGVDFNDGGITYIKVAK